MDYMVINDKFVIPGNQYHLLMNLGVVVSTSDRITQLEIIDESSNFIWMDERRKEYYQRWVYNFSGPKIRTYYQGGIETIAKIHRFLDEYSIGYIKNIIKHSFRIRNDIDQIKIFPIINLASLLKIYYKPITDQILSFFDLE